MQWNLSTETIISIMENLKKTYLLQLSKINRKTGHTDVLRRQLKPFNKNQFCVLGKRVCEGIEMKWCLCVCVHVCGEWAVRVTKEREVYHEVIPGHGAS